MIEVNNWFVVGTIATILALIVSLIAALHNNKIMKEGLKNLSDLVELKRKENEREYYKAQLEKKEQKTREKWKNFEVGLKILDFIAHLDEDE